MKKLLLFLMLSVILLSCEEELPDDGLTAYQRKVIAYFQDIALGFEIGTAAPVTRKWNTEMKVFVGGNPSADLTTELNLIIAEVNSFASDGFQISVTSDSLQSNCYIFFGSGADYAARYPDAGPYIANNWGLFTVYFNAQNFFTRAVMYIDTERATDINAQKHLLREELVQSLGLAKDSKEHATSIFQEAWTTTTFFSEIDKDLVRILYHPDMHPGLNEITSEPVLKEIVKELGI